MSADLATLGIVIDSSQAKTAAGALDELASAGGRAEKSTKGASAAAAQMAASAQASARAAMGFSLGARSVGESASYARVAMLDMTHVGINLTQMLASGVNPMRALVLESGRIATAVQYAGGSIGNLFRQTAEWLGLIQVTRDAELAEAAANAIASAAAVSGAAQRAAANVLAADTELALAEAEAAVATTSEAATAAQLRLTKAHEGITAAATEATIAERALAIAQGRAAAAAEADARTTIVALSARGAAITGVLTGTAIAAGLVYGAFKTFQSQVANDHTLDTYAKSLGLTKKEFRELQQTVGDLSSKEMKDLEARARAFQITWGDVWNGIAKSAADALDLTPAWNKFKRDAENAFIDVLNKAVKFAAYMKAFWTTDIGPGFWDNVKKNAADAEKEISKNVATIRANIIGAAEDRIKKAADAIIEDRTPKKPKKVSDHGLADALAELDAQIKGQNALAAAYQVSDAAAIKAEALQRAEEQAIRHKGDVALFYEKELALAVAQRAADGGRLIADIHAEAAARSVVNDLVEQGIIPVQRMGQALDEQQKKRQLMAALDVAEDKGWLKQAADLRAEIGNLAFSQGVLNDEIAKEAALRQIAKNKDDLDHLKLEIELVGESNKVRAERLAGLEAERFIRDNNITDPKDKADLTKGYVDAAAAAVDLANAQELYNRSLSYTADLLALMNDRAQIMASTLSDAFGNVGSGIGQAITALSSYAAQQAKLDQEHAAAVKAGLSDEQEVDRYRKASMNNQLAGTAQLIGGLKSMFKEHSTGYKAMEAAERAFAIIQAISTIKSVAAGAAKMFSQLGVWAFPAVAAMIAVMAGLGFKGGSSSAKPPTSAQDIQSAQGAGTILGDASAKSDSIAHSLDLTAKNTNKMLEYDNQQLRTLRNIEMNIGALAAQVAKELQVGGAFDLTGKTGSSSSSGFLGLFGSTTTKSLYDQGLTFNPTTLASAIANGISGSTYQIIEKVKESSGFLGIGSGTSTSYSTTTGALDPDLQRQVGLILGQLRDSVVSAAKVLGFNVAAALDQFQVEIGKISFKDMSADEITKALEAVFSKVADQMAGFAVSGLEKFQKAGEGLFETLQRLAKDYTTIDVALKSIGKTFGSVGSASIAARERLISLFGTLENFVDATSFYQQNFLTGAEQLSILKASVSAQLSSLGLSGINTIAAFKHVVDGLNLTTTAGQDMYAALMQLAPAFYQMIQLQDQAAQAAAALAKQKAQLEITLLQAQGKATEALAKQREMELAALDPSLRALQQQVYQAQDVAAAKDKLAQAYQRERDALQSTIDKFGAISKGLREYRDSLFGVGSGTATYNQALANLIKTGSLASAGDVSALGDLQGAGKSFLDIARDRAGSLQQYQRDVALVARYVDQGITASDGQKSVAERQLAAMTDQVGKLIDINASVLSVKDAVTQLNALLAPAPSSAPGATGGGSASGGETERQRRERRVRTERRLDELTAAVQQLAVSTNQQTRIIKTWDRGGSMAVSTDSDTPLVTTAS